MEENEKEEKNRSKGEKKKREKGKGEREKSLEFSTHFKAVQFNIVTDIFAVCKLNHFNSKEEIRTIFVYI